MAWGESNSGEELILDYNGMCNNLCKCNNVLGYCLGSRKNEYKTNRCKSACEAWFPNDPSFKMACQAMCNSNRPISKADYLNKFPTGCNNIPAFYIEGDTSWMNTNCVWDDTLHTNVDITKIPCNEIQSRFPGVSQTWYMWAMSKCTIPGSSSDPNAIEDPTEKIEKETSTANKTILIVAVILIILIIAIAFYLSYND